MGLAVQTVLCPYRNYSVMINNTGKVAVIFGIRNDSSIAYDIAVKLHGSGCSIAMNFMEDTKANVLQLVNDLGISEHLAAEVDVRNEAQIQAFLTSVYDILGPIDYILHGVAFGNQMVMCTGSPGTEKNEQAYLDIPFEDLMDSFNISAYSLLRISRVASPMLAAGASILTLTYNASQKVFPGYAGMSVNKAALENIMIYLAHHFRKQSVRVNAISAGLIMTTSAGGISGVRKLRKITKFTAPLGNVTAGDVGNTAIYYFSDLSKKITGNIHFVDGGYHIMGVSSDEG